jgi:homoaconitate hydratase
MTISNMTTEWGALAGVFPYDETTRVYLLSRAKHFKTRGDAEPRMTVERIERLEAELPIADADAFYAKKLEFDLLAVSPFVAGPNEVKTITPLPELEERNVRIDKAFLMSCVNARLEDFETAADVIRGKRVHEGVKLYIAAASSEVEDEARKRGYWQALLEAGAIALPPGCGACIGLGEGVLGAGEVGISATNRNFKGRMGSRDSFVYLSSPAVVAASAVAGKIAGPHTVTPAAAEKVAAGAPAGRDPKAHRERLERGSACRVHPRAAGPRATVAILPGFPESIEGELLFVPKDNMNTDGIYGKEFTYQDDLTPEEMGTKAMLNYDPEFQNIVEKGDILVGGYNFGSGSSREQAATALKFRGIRMIIAGSYSQTYKRNAFNNGFIVIECPELVDELRSAHKADDALTIRTGRKASIDFTGSRIQFDGKLYSFAPLGEVAQELVVKGGFEALIREELSEYNRPD